MTLNTVGSICSGIEAASVAWKNLNLEFKWFSEIADFPSRFLNAKYPNIPNIGDMNNIPELLLNRKIDAPDIICGGTPCQAFSYAGSKNGLNDDRGNLTLKFVDIIEANDKVRTKKHKKPTVVFWENVEGALSDKTNAFGCFISSLAGINTIIENKKWPSAGLIRGPKRNVAWRVLDAKYFGVPQQRRRLYVLAGGKEFNPEDVLFELHTHSFSEYPSFNLSFRKNGHKFEVFRAYTDCLYSAYGTKWNGNAAAYNGSLFIVQDGRIRRLSPLECERLMGFPDDYTNITDAKRTNRYQATGNSWAVPVVYWIGKRLIDKNLYKLNINETQCLCAKTLTPETTYFDFEDDVVNISNIDKINCSVIPEDCKFASIKDIVSHNAPDKIYISPVGCYGIIRRSQERNLSINPKLLKVLQKISSEMSIEEIEKKSKLQNRGKYSKMDYNPKQTE